MKKLLLSMMVVIAAFGVAAGQSRREQRALRGTKDTVEKITVGDLERSYVLHVPPALAGSKIDAKKDTRAPLVLVFHGGGGHAWNMPKFTHFDALADQQGFIVVYPESHNTHWNDTRALSPADDVAFVRALISELVRNYHVDARRVYATGISNGGFFSNRLACDLADKIVAIASVAATMPDSLVPVCKPSRAVSVMYLNGDQDPLVPINGGPIARKNGTCISLADAAKFWRDIDGTSPKPREEDLPVREEDGTSIRKQTWPDGKQQSEVVVYTVHGGGHTWPGGQQYMPAIIVGRVSHQLDATRTIWEFLRSHSLPDKP
jgi:polyhydroxybutyrate depolymerase